MEQQFNPDEVISLTIYTLMAFTVLLLTVFIFTYFIRRRVFEEQLKTKEIELQAQKDILSAIIETQEKERSRIAKDLHDDVSSKLNSITMSVHVLKQNDLSDEDRVDISEQTLTACNSLIENARNIAHNLMPPVLENVGLHLAIKELCTCFTTSNLIQIIYENKNEQRTFEGLDKEKQVHLYRIIQELINNSIRHGKASKIEFLFDKKGSKRYFSYADNGVGLQSDSNSSNGIGTKNINTRAQILGGLAKFKTEKSPGYHFTLNF